MYEEACLAYGLSVLNNATKDRYRRLNVGIKKPFNLLGFISHSIINLLIHELSILFIQPFIHLTNYYLLQLRQDNPESRNISLITYFVKSSLATFNKQATYNDPNRTFMTLASNFLALVLRRFHGLVYFQNGFGANVEYLLNSTNQSVTPTNLKMFLFFFCRLTTFSFPLWYFILRMRSQTWWIIILFLREKSTLKCV